MATLLGLAWCCALAAIALESWRRHAAFYILKPLATLLILAGAAVAPWDTGQTYALWLLVALALCLAGDVLLMREGERWFLAGLVAFLLAHAALVLAFLHDVPLARPPWSFLLAISLPAAALGVVLLPRAGRLAAPVVLYQAVLLAMAASAWMRWHGAEAPCLGGHTRGCEGFWAGLLAARPPAAARALVGSLLFLASDACLGVRQFVRPYRGDQALILSLYWLAISLLASSVAAP